MGSISAVTMAVETGPLKVVSKEHRWVANLATKMAAPRAEQKASRLADWTAVLKAATTACSMEIHWAERSADHLAALKAALRAQTMAGHWADDLVSTLAANSVCLTVDVMADLKAASRAALKADASDVMTAGSSDAN
jgi:hypothetical protein